MSDSKSVKIHYDVAGDDFDRAGEASAGLKRLLQKIGVPADIIDVLLLEPMKLK